MYTSTLPIWIFCVAAAAALGPQNPSVRPTSGVTTYYPPTAGKLDGGDFMNWATVQARNNIRVLAIAQGEYHVTPGSQDAHIFLSGLTTGLTIWMDGVNLTMTEVGLQAFQFYLCTDLVTYGPTVWWDTPGFSQATITEVLATDTTGQNFDITFHLDDGYDPSFLLDSASGVVSGEYTNPTNGRLQPGPGWSTISGTAKPAQGGNNLWTMPLMNSYFTPIIGWKLLARGEFLFCNLVASCHNTVINDFTLLNCGGFGWMSNLNTRTTFNSLTIKPASFPPPNGTELPVRASSADGVHSSDDFIGPGFDSCLFTALDDDCIAIHGSLNTISSISDSAPDSMISSSSSTLASTTVAAESSSSTLSTSSCTFSTSTASPSCQAPPAFSPKQVSGVMSGEVKYSLLGCVKVDINDNKLPLDWSTSGGAIVMNNMTIEYCAALAKGDTYFGLTVGVQCIWSNHFTSTGYDAVAISSCDSICLGNADEACGAENLLQVYSSNPSDAEFTPAASLSPGSIIPNVKGSDNSWTYQGCYQYGFNGNFGYYAGKTTLEGCANYCSGLGAPGMSLRYAAYCYCGYQEYCTTRFCDSACSAPCIGNASEACGSDYFGMTYTLDEPSQASSSTLQASTISSPSTYPTTLSTTFTAPSGRAFPGAILQFYSTADSWNPLGSAKVINASGGTPITITVAGSLSALGVDVTSSWVNINQTGSGFSITNTFAGNNRGRGAIIKASDGIIANNVFSGVAYAGIDIGPEFTYWSEAGYVNNVSIVSNLVDSCNYLDKATSAVMIHGDGDTPINGNINVTIQGLTIRNTSASNLYIGGSSGVSVEGVVFENVFQDEPVLWETWPGAVATFENVSSVDAGSPWGCILGGVGRSGVVPIQKNGNVTGIGTLSACS